MVQRPLYTQEGVNTELREFGDVLGDSFCELVAGNIPADAESEARDSQLQATLREKIQVLVENPTKPQFILYQMPAGQQSLICLAMDADGQLLVGYRDLDSRPPTKRVRQSIDEVVKEFGL